MGSKTSKPSPKETSDLVIQTLANTFLALFQLNPIIADGPLQSVSQAIDSLYAAQAHFNRVFLPLGIVLEGHNEIGFKGDVTSALGWITYEALVEENKNLPSNRLPPAVFGVTGPKMMFLRYKWFFNVQGLPLDSQLKSAVCVLLRYMLSSNYEYESLRMRKMLKNTKVGVGASLDLLDKRQAATANFSYKKAFVYDTAFLQNLYRTVICTLLPTDPEQIKQQREQVNLNAFDEACEVVFNLDNKTAILEEKTFFFEFSKDNLKKPTFLTLLDAQVRKIHYRLNLRQRTEEMNIDLFSLEELIKHIQQYKNRDSVLISQLETIIMLDSVVKSFKEL